MHVQTTTSDAAAPRASAAGVDATNWTLVPGLPALPGPAPVLVPTAAELESWHAGTRLEHVLVAAVRRTVEIVVAVVALAVTWPVMIVVGIIVKLDTPGPALFRQTRVGLNGRHFTFYKFRTLYVDARERFPELYAYKYTPEQVQNLKFKRETDPRITPAGRWLRKSTLDELPNFWNLLRGEIAIVGPRPEIPEMVKHYLPAQLGKFSVKPGITGFAQTHGRGNLAFQQTIAYDLEYVRRRSVMLDIRLIFRTVRMLLKLEGAY